MKIFMPPQNDSSMFHSGAVIGDLS